MSFIESDRMSGVSGSIIRELFKMTAAPDMISFAGGNPSPDTFPMEEMAAIASLDAYDELAERVGISNVNLSKLKTGKVSAIRFSTLNAICIALHCQPGDILEFSEDAE